MVALGGAQVFGKVRTPGITRWLLSPAIAFLLISLPLGIATLAINPPLRGYDETAHFIRIYAISNGDVVPTTRDDQNRRGTFIPDRLNAQMRLFDEARKSVHDRTSGFDYREVYAKYDRLLTERRDGPDSEHTVFALLEGAEAYSPIPYLPQIVAAWIGRAFDADFVTLVTLMRVAAFLVTTAVTAYAIAVVPNLRWGFLTIAMLPSAFYARTLIGVDGALLSFSLLVTALALRRAFGADDVGPWQRAVVMTLCVASKPPQVVWMSLELMTRPLREWARHWRELALITLPGLALTIAWVLAMSGDVGVWRVSSGTHTPAEFFGAGQQLLLWLFDPLRFPRMLVASLGSWEIYELWRQLIGILGWLDTALQSWVYPSLSALLIASFLAPLPLDAATRVRVAAICLSAAVAYALCVYLIFYLAWTPTTAPEIWGVQGRYFVVVLAPLAVGFAALVNRGPPEFVRAAIAVCAAALSGFATIEAILRVNW
jgi:uncharacterized membrane protein